eukprot:gene13170-biopygen2260
MSARQFSGAGSDSEVVFPFPATCAMCPRRFLTVQQALRGREGVREPAQSEATTHAAVAGSGVDVLSDLARIKQNPVPNRRGPGKIGPSPKKSAPNPGSPKKNRT